MEGLAIDPGFWAGRKVLVTGHTGFKGSWLCAWLHRLGARLEGVALSPQSAPNMFELLALAQDMRSHLFDINDRAKLANVLRAYQPEIVFHMAAQSLVRYSYCEPIETFMTNVVGTVTLLDVIRTIPSVTAVVVVTSDKCYENQEWVWGYRESDRLGGHDPYSASKGCTEIAAQSMQKSFFAPFANEGHGAKIATARAGNVIGGGDWADDRLIPDIVRGCLGASGAIHLRNPAAIRPWQHVLEPLRGYMRLAEALTNGTDGADTAWNFGPEPRDEQSVQYVAETMISALGKGRVTMDASDGNAPHEAGRLRLDCAKAKERLGWQPLLSLDQAVRLTADWYVAWSRGDDLRALTNRQINAHMHRCTATPTKATP